MLFYIRACSPDFIYLATMGAGGRAGMELAILLMFPRHMPPIVDILLQLSLHVELKRGVDGYSSL